MEPSGQPRAQMVTGMQQRTATPTRTLGVAGSTRDPRMLPTVGETAAEVGAHNLIATHRRSAAGAATLATVAGVHGPAVRKAGAAEAAVVVGAVEDSVAERSSMIGVWV